MWGRYSTFGTLALGLAAAFPALAGSIELSPQQRETVLEFGRGLQLSAAEAIKGDTELAAANALKAAYDFLIPGFGSDLPDWAKRVEFEVRIGEENRPEYSILTVQPLFETEDLGHTVFTQLSQRRYWLFDEYRNVTNAGLGYRHVFNNNTMLVGLNNFFDYEWENHHQRYSVGAEFKWAGLDFGANRYWGISSPHSVKTAGDREEPLDGHDLFATMQVPFVPWARVKGRKFWWDNDLAGSDTQGWTISAEADLHQNLQIEAGATQANNLDQAEEFVRIRFKMDLGRPVALSSEPISSQPWEMRDMRDYRLDKVERQNRIVVERVSSGVVITRGD